MTFTAPGFLFLALTVSLAVYFFFVARAETAHFGGYWLLLLSICLYYYYDHRTWLFAASIVMNYLGSRCVASAYDASARTRVLAVFVTLNLLYLGYFKYISSTF